jgi:hypothetical protein
VDGLEPAYFDRMRVDGEWLVFDVLMAVQELKWEQDGERGGEMAYHLVCHQRMRLDEDYAGVWETFDL